MNAPNKLAITNTNFCYDQHSGGMKNTPIRNNPTELRNDSSNLTEHAIDINYTNDAKLFNKENVNLDISTTIETNPINFEIIDRRKTNRNKIRKITEETFESNSSSRDFSESNSSIKNKNLKLLENLNKKQDNKINNQIEYKGKLPELKKEINMDIEDISLQRYHTYTDKSSSKEAINSDIHLFNGDNKEEIITPETVSVEEDYSKKIGENFCEAFFISGIPYKDAKVIPDSIQYTAPCQHENCSLFCAYRPEIIYRLPTKDFHNFEVNNNDASLCFPSGIKLCFEKNEKKVRAINNFLTTITNANGERLYMMNYHFYKKLDVFNYQSQYKDAHPLRYFYSKILPQLEDKDNLPPKNMIKKLQKMRDVCNQFSENDYLYLPYCFSVISSNPNGPTMENTLESIVKILSNYKREENKTILESLLTHILYEIPSPPINSSLSFQLPFIQHPLSLHSKVYNNLVCTNYNINIIFDYSIDNIILIHYLMLMEQKILFIAPCKEYQVLQQITEAFMTLLYPIRWVNTYIPVLSEDLVKYLQSFMPFIMGIEESLMKLAEFHLDNESVYIFDMKRDLVLLSNGKKKMDLKTIWKDLPAMPEEIVNFLRNELKTLKKQWEKVKKERKEDKLENKLTEIDVLIREVFTRSMVKLFGDYKNFTSIIDEVALFNTASLIANRNSHFMKFYTDLTQSQNFRQFIQLATSNEEVFYYIYFEQICHNSNPSCKHNYHTIQNEIAMKTKPPNSTKNSGNKLNKLSQQSQLIPISQSAKSNPDFKDSSNSLLRLFSLPPFFKRENLGQNKLANKHKIERRVFDESFDFSIFVSILQSPPKEIMKYPIINQQLTQFDHSHMPFHFFKIHNKEDEFSKQPEQPGDKILNQLADIKEKRKLIMSLQEKDEKVDTYIKQQIKRKQSLISIILSSDMKQLAIYQKQIGNIIKDEMGKVLTSIPLGKENLRDLSYIFKYRYARSKFAKIVFQEKFKDNIKLCLEDKSFEEMYEIVTNALICCQSDPQFEDARLITKSTFYYYKIIQKNYSPYYYYLYRKIAKKTPFNFWKQTDFWKFYLDAEIDENTFNLSDNIRNVEEYYFEMLLLVARVMIDLGLDIQLVTAIICDSIAHNYIKNGDLHVELKKTLEKIDLNIKMLK